MRHSPKNSNYRWLAGLALGCLACSLVLPSEVLAQNDGYWNGTETEAFAGGAIREVYCEILGLIDGNLGGLLMSAVGVLAFGAAAFGDLKHGITAVVTGVSAFTIAALMSLYFGDLCGGGGTNRVANPAQQRALTAQERNFDAALAIGRGATVDYGNFNSAQQEDEEGSYEDPLGF